VVSANERSRVLVVDDDEAIRDAMREALEEDGYDVVTAGNGVEALEVLQAVPAPSAIVVDMMMPIMDGWQLVQRLKSDSRLSQIPVIAMSAGGNRTLATSPVCKDYLAKPVKVSRLLEAIARCRRPPPLAA
jgi:CheY-like chemotaxis protein